MAHLYYARHLVFLICFVALLSVLTRLRLLSDLSVAFAVYGALHALAVVLALREREALWRRLLFIAIAAALSALTLRLGMIGMQVSGTLPGNLGLYVALGCSAIVAAMSYGILMRVFGIHELTPRCLALISAACTVGTYAAFFTLAHTHWLGRWLLAAFWWCGFSGGLWYCDVHRRNTEPAPSTASGGNGSTGDPRSGTIR